MQDVPVEVRERIERAKGTPVDLWIEPEWPGGMRVVVVFRTENEPPLGVTIDRLFEAQWPFAGTPRLRVAWRMQAIARDVRISTVQSFQLPGSDPAVRLEVELEGAAPLAFEGAVMHIGPVPLPKPGTRGEPEHAVHAQTFDA
jgi:hypothetical protein